VRGSNAPCRKYVSPAFSTCTKRNLLRVALVTLLQHAGGTRTPNKGTRGTFTSCGPHPQYTFTSCGLRPPYCCFVPAVPATLSCLAATDTGCKLFPLAGCVANLYIALYEFITNSWYFHHGGSAGTRCTSRYNIIGWVP
jgi:hypothetical protein